MVKQIYYTLTTLQNNLSSWVGCITLTTQINGNQTSGGLQTLEVTSGGAHKNQTSWNFKVVHYSIFPSTLGVFQHKQGGCSSEVWAYAFVSPLYTKNGFSSIISILKGSSIQRIFLYESEPVQLRPLALLSEAMKLKKEIGHATLKLLLFLPHAMINLFLYKIYAIHWVHMAPESTNTIWKEKKEHMLEVKTI